MSIQVSPEEIDGNFASEQDEANGQVESGELNPKVVLIIKSPKKFRDLELELLQDENMETLVIYNVKI